MEAAFLQEFGIQVPTAVATEFLMQAGNDLDLALALYYSQLETTTNVDPEPTYSYEDAAAIFCAIVNEHIPDASLKQLLAESGGDPNKAALAYMLPRTLAPMPSSKSLGHTTSATEQELELYLITHMGFTRESVATFRQSRNPRKDLQLAVNSSEKDSPKVNKARTPEDIQVLLQGKVTQTELRCVMQSHTACCAAPRTIAQITAWVAATCGPITLERIPEMISYVDSGFHHIMKYRLRPVQVAALAIFLAKGNQGRLAEIKTGEGKSNIVAALAICLALHCPSRQVDVVTSHEQLAIREVRGKLVELFRLFNLSVDHNINEKESVCNEFRKCYDANIVYGTTSSFCFDVLGHDYFRTNNRGERQFANMIVDEVDSMFVDNAQDVCRIASYAAGFQDVLLALVKIWYLTRFLQHDSEAQYTYCNGSGLSKLEAIEKLQRDFTAYLCVKPEISNAYSKLSEIGKRAMNHKTLLCVSPMVARFMERHIRSFAESAINAKFHVHLEKDYVVQDGKVTIVDVANTGEIKRGCQWNNGLHQFLQLKHGLDLTHPTLETNFISSRALFQKYGANLYGLTGTLGAEPARELLRRAYNVAMVDIPTDKPVQRYQYPALCLPDKRQHTEAIANGCAVEIEAGRAVLVICKTILDGRALEHTLRHKVHSARVKTVLVSSEDVDLRLGRGEVIISTNLLGRGADIELSSEVIANGGLHVIVAMIPRNRRVRDQAFGRSGRKGLPGSCQMVVHLPGLPRMYMPTANFEAAVYSDEHVGYEALWAEMEDNAARESVFADYCKLLASLGLRNHDPAFKAIEERWALFYRTYHDSPKELRANLEQEVVAPIRAQQAGGLEGIIQTPGLLTRRANEADGLSGQERVQLCTRALEQDPRHWMAATARVGHMLNANTRKSEIYSKGQVLQAITEAKEVTAAAVERKMSSLYAQQWLSAEPNRVPPVGRDVMEGVGRVVQQPRLAAAGIVRQAPQAAQANAGVPNALRDQDVMRDVGHVVPQAVPQAARNPADDAEVGAANANIQALDELAQAVAQAKDIKDLMVTWDPLDDDAPMPLPAEGLPGKPKPAERPKKGSWWPILVGIVCCAVGAFLAVTGIAAPLGVALIASGIDDIAIGIQSLESGIPVSFGEWFKGKSQRLMTVVSNFFGVASNETQQYAAQTTVPVRVEEFTQSPAATKAAEAVVRQAERVQQSYHEKETWLRQFQGCAETEISQVVAREAASQLSLLAVLSAAFQKEDFFSALRQGYQRIFLRPPSKIIWTGKVPLGSNAVTGVAAASNIETALQSAFASPPAFLAPHLSDRFSGAWNIFVTTYPNGLAGITQDNFADSLRRLNDAGALAPDGLCLVPSPPSVPGALPAVVQFCRLAASNAAVQQAKNDVLATLVDLCTSVIIDALMTAEGKYLQS